MNTITHKYTIGSAVFFVLNNEPQQGFVASLFIEVRKNYDVEIFYYIAGYVNRYLEHELFGNFDGFRAYWIQKVEFENARRLAIVDDLVIKKP